MVKKVYIAGPMRGYPQYNFPAFDAAAALGRSLGWLVISPADMDRNAGINEKEDDTPDFHPAKVRVFMRRDTDVLVNQLQAERGDAIALLPGWQKSTGARAELALAQWAKLAILDATTFQPMEVELVGKTFHPPQQAALCSIKPDAGLVRVAEAVANGELK